MAAKPSIKVPPRHGLRGRTSITAEEAERGLICCLIALPSAIGAADVVALNPAHMTDDRYRVLFRHLVGLNLEGRLPECLAVRLKSAGDYEAAGGQLFVRELFREASGISGSDAAYFASKITEAAQFRSLELIGPDIQELIEERKTPAEIVSHLLSVLDRVGTPSEVAKRLEFLTSAQLSETDPDVPYVVPGVLAELQPAVVGGPSKAMKTSSLLDLLIAISTAGCFFGFFRVAKQKRCWLLSGESGQNVIAESARRIAAAANRDLHQIDMRWSFRLPRLADSGDVRELGRIVKGEGIGVLGIDPLYLSLDTGGQESSMFSMGTLLRPIGETCAENGCTLLVAHHFRQSIRDFDAPQLQDLSHSGVEQFARQWILLKRRKAYVAGTGEHRLHLVTGGSAGHGGSFAVDIDEGVRGTPEGRFWEVTVRPASEAQAADTASQMAASADREARRRQDHREKVLAALRLCPKGETRTALRAASSLNHANFTEAIGSLIADHTVEVCEVQKHTAKHDGYRLSAHQKTLCPDMAGQGQSIRA